MSQKAPKSQRDLTITVINRALIPTDQLLNETKYNAVVDHITIIKCFTVCLFCGNFWKFKKTVSEVVCFIDIDDI